ncbi:ABC transporter permease subunit [Pediococcus acidilactici]|nr:ABC transporter permease subunit [Pediococcus acidilactici]UWF33604.1 ABC transporter permease [Pediococcus acidilactici]
MTRILAISQRVLKELFRDKRTLALMFLAPILILVLLSLIFNNNASTKVNVATVGVTKAVNQDLEAVKHVKVMRYKSQATARKALNEQQVDAIIKKSGANYTVTHANTDATKTSVVKMAFNNVRTMETMQKMRGRLQQIMLTNAKLQAKLAQVTHHAPQAKGGALQNKSISNGKVTSHYVYGDKNTNFFDKILPILMGFFVFFFVFLVSGMALLKERTSGTLDRLLATPVKRSEIVLGYMISYGIIAILQTVVIVLVTIQLLGAEVVGNVLNIIVVNLLLALVALAFGILLSTFANSEFQMMQFIPIVVVPQVFFAGIIPLDTMADWVQKISYVMPLKYAGDAVTDIMMYGTNLLKLGGDLGILLGFLVVLTMLNIAGLRRYRKV